MIDLSLILGVAVLAGLGVAGVLLWKAMSVMGYMLQKTARHADQERRDIFQQIERMAEKAINMSVDERIRLMEAHMQERVHRVTQDSTVEQIAEQRDTSIPTKGEEELLADTMC